MVWLIQDWGLRAEVRKLKGWAFYMNQKIFSIEPHPELLITPCIFILDGKNYEFKPGEERKFECGLLAKDAHRETYCFPISVHFLEDFAQAFLRTALMEGSAAFREMVLKSYICQENIRISDTVILWSEYADLFKYSKFYTLTPKPPQILSLEDLS